MVDTELYGIPAYFFAISPSAIVKAIGNGTMTVQFSNLEMKADGYDMITYDPKSFTFKFNGTVKVEFEL